ncbi:hypothetical protein [Streptomyces sp. ATCC 21386]|uniref:hypothetical protein n=1 Tax=Streptomyces sp. ATCC 21386 TaxID=2699428 RepID=UPI001BFFD485
MTIRLPDPFLTDRQALDAPDFSRFAARDGLRGRVPDKASQHRFEALARHPTGPEDARDFARGVDDGRLDADRSREPELRFSLNPFVDREVLQEVTEPVSGCKMFADMAEQLKGARRRSD